MTDKMFDPKTAPFATQGEANAPEISTEKTQPVVETNVTQNASVEDDNYDDVAQTVEVGQKVSDYPIDKFRIVKGKVTRIAILSRKWKAVKSHFEQGIGNFYCFDGVCCQSEGGRAKRRYLVPILVYETDIKGQVTGKTVNVQYMVLSGKNYEPLSLIDQAQPLNTSDLNVLCEDEKYQTKSFIPIPGKALWLQDEVFTKEVVTEYKRLEPFILKAFARKIGRTPEESQAMYLKLKQDSTQFDVKTFSNSGVQPYNTSSTPDSSAAPADPTTESFDIDTYLQS